jgi:hypothetical protein
VDTETLTEKLGRQKKKKKKNEKNKIAPKCVSQARETNIGWQRPWVKSFEIPLQKGKQVYIIVSHFTFFFRLYEEKFGSQ